MFIVVVASIIILLISMLLMGIKVVLKKDGRFPDTHIGSNQSMRKRGISCAATQDYEAGRRKNIFQMLDKQLNIK